MIGDFMTVLVCVVVFVVGLYHLTRSFIRWWRMPPADWLPVEPTGPSTAPVAHDTPIDMVLGSVSEWPVVPVCERCLVLERRLRQSKDEARLWQSRAEAYRNYLPELHSILCRVRDHHLPGWKMSDVGMCPVCVESKLFERVQTLFGSMQFWDNKEPPQ